MDGNAGLEDEVGHCTKYSMDEAFDNVLKD